VSGATPKSHVTQYWNGKIIWITPTDLGKNDALYVSDSERRITEAGYENSNTELVPPGAVVMSSRAPIGHLAIAAAFLCTNQGCKSFVPIAEIDSRFLYFLLKWHVPDFRQVGSGATFAEVSKGQLENFCVALPTFAEQQRIAKKLAGSFERVKHARAAAEAQLETAQVLLRSKLRMIFDSPEVRCGRTMFLGDLLQLVQDVVHPHDDPSGSATFVGLEHVESHTGVRIGSLPLQMERLTGRKPRFRKGQIVYGYLRPYLNKVWIAEFDGLCSVDQYVYTVSSDIADTEFLAWFMRSPGYLKRAKVDGGPGQLPRIRTEEVATVELSLPSLKEQRRLAGEINAFFRHSRKVCESINEQLQAIDSYPAALLHRAFGGEL
jgi:type I restriction enzyme S subunit